MTDVFRIDMLPAHEGDCLWMEYGDADKPHRIIIDGGRGKVGFEAIESRAKNLPDDQQQFELVVLTHVDADHIEGIIRLVADDTPPIRFKDLWFNAFHHLDKDSFQGLTDDSEVEEFGGVQGETLTEALLTKKLPWNLAFGRAPVVVPDDGVLPTVDLAGGMKLTVLGPTWPKLEKLRPKWKKEVEKAGLVPGAHVEEEEELEEDEEAFGPPTIDEVEEMAVSQFKGDSTAANGSSIALVAEFKGRRVLLTGDAQMDLLEKKIDAFAGDDDSRREFAAIKISHHGSKKTLSNGMLERVKCGRYLISTNGSRHKHPNREAIARILKFGGDQKTLFFNYGSEFTKVWDLKKLKTEFSYETEFPAAANDGTMRVELI
jgi:beta-lactamase superfamily II metal-dependent hydrolase